MQKQFSLLLKQGWVLGLCLVFLLTACGEKAKDKEDFEAPAQPEVRLASNAGAIGGVKTVSCWPQGEENLTCDLANINATPSNELTLPSGETLTVVIDAEQAPSSVTVISRELDSNGEPLVSMTLDEAKQVDLSALGDGEHFLEITTYYDDLNGTDAVVTTLFALTVGEVVAVDATTTPQEGVNTPEETEEVATLEPTEELATVDVSAESTNSAGTAMAIVTGIAQTAEAGTPTGDGTPEETEAVDETPVATESLDGTVVATEETAETPIATEVTGETPVASEVVGETPVVTEETGETPVASEVVGETPIATEVTGETPVATEVVITPVASEPVVPTATNTAQVLPTLTPSFTPTTVPTNTASAPTFAPTIAPTLPTNPTPTAEQPLTLRVAGILYQPVGITTCAIASDGTETCEEEANPSAVRVQSQIGSAVTVVYDGERPNSMDYAFLDRQFQPVTSGTRGRSNAYLFNVDVPAPGLYILSVKLYWDEQTITYFYQIYVRG